MIKTLKSLFGPKPEPVLPAIPSGERIYAVGDIHGRLDLMEALALAIDADDAKRGPAETTIILLGDLVDRGPDSASVVSAARKWAERRHVRFISGNHEEMFLDSLVYSETLKVFVKYGGVETILSYGIDPLAYSSADIDTVRELLLDAVPYEDVTFLHGFEDMIVKGDYLFVHAGIRPGVPISEQRFQSLHWIREPFLSSEENHGFVIVHGHTIVEKADFRPNRIAIDTGAFMTGRLTALCLEGTERWLMETRDDGENIAVTSRSVT